MEEIKVYTLKNEFLKVEFLNLGAIIKKIELKDKNGNIIKGTKVPEKLTAGGWGQKSDLYIDINF